MGLAGYPEDTSGIPSDADLLIGTANPDVPNGIVVGTTPSAIRSFLGAAESGINTDISQLLALDSHTIGIDRYTTAGTRQASTNGLIIFDAGSNACTLELPNHPVGQLSQIVYRVMNFGTVPVTISRLGSDLLAVSGTSGTTATALLHPGQEMMFTGIDFGAATIWACVLRSNNLIRTDISTTPYTTAEGTRIYNLIAGSDVVNLATLTSTSYPCQQIFHNISASDVTIQPSGGNGLYTPLGLPGSYTLSHNSVVEIVSDRSGNWSVKSEALAEVPVVRGGTGNIYGFGLTGPEVYEHNAGTLTMAADDGIGIVLVSGGTDIKLPPVASSISNGVPRIVYIKQYNAATVTIVPADGDGSIINFSSGTFTLTGPHQSIAFYSDGTSWFSFATERFGSLNNLTSYQTVETGGTGNLEGMGLIGPHTTSIGVGTLTLVANDRIGIITASGGTNIVLPPAATSVYTDATFHLHSRSILIKHDTTPGTITITSTDGSNINDGQASLLLTGVNDAIMFYTNGTNWFSFGRDFPIPLDPTLGGTGLTTSGVDDTQFLKSDGAGGWELGPAGATSDNVTVVTVSSVTLDDNSTTFIGVDTTSSTGCAVTINACANGKEFIIYRHGGTDDVTVSCEGTTSYFALLDNANPQYLGYAYGQFMQLKAFNYDFGAGDETNWELLSQTLMAPPGTSTYTAASVTLGWIDTDYSLLDPDTAGGTQSVELPAIPTSQTFEGQGFTFKFISAGTVTFSVASAGTIDGSATLEVVGTVGTSRTMKVLDGNWYAF